MITSNRIFSSLESLAKLGPDLKDVQSESLQALPSLRAVLTEFTPLPRAALFIGLANDGLPILLNLLDPLPGPIMIVGDKGSGKTNFIKTVSSAIDQVHPPDDVKYVVITNDLSEWAGFQRSANCENILSVEEAILTQYMHSLVEWAHTNKADRQIYLLFIDNFEAFLKDSELRNDLSWLLLRGPARRVWPVVTVGSTSAVSKDLQPWLNSFRSRLFGNIHNDRESQWLTGLPNISFDKLVPGVQFAMREGNDWLQFWIPKLD